MASRTYLRALAIPLDSIPTHIREYITLQNGYFSVPRMRDVVKSGIDVPRNVIDEFIRQAPNSKIPLDIPTVHNPTTREELEILVRTFKSSSRRHQTVSQTSDADYTTGTIQVSHSEQVNFEEQEQEISSKRNMAEEQRKEKDHDQEREHEEESEQDETEEERLAREAKAKEKRDGKRAENSGGNEEYIEGLLKLSERLDILKTEFEKAKEDYKKQDEVVKTTRAQGRYDKEAEDMLFQLLEKAKKAQAAVKKINVEIAYFQNTDKDPIPRSKKTYADLYTSDTSGQINRRNADGTLIPASDADMSDSLLNLELTDGVNFERLKKAFDILSEVNGGPFYNAESNALGFMQESMYFLVPENYGDMPCAIELVGAGWKEWNLDLHWITKVYALAKQQVSGLSWSEEKKIKWAMMRMEAFKNGWFAYQTFTRYEKPPANHDDIFSADITDHRDWLVIAKKLSGFVPFVIEYHFRAYNRSYDKTTAQEYMMKVRSLAKAVQGEDMLDYTDDEIVYGDCFRWIQVQRPVQVMEAIKKTARLADAFKMRLKSAPAGRALIGTSWAVIQSLTSAGWWAKLKKVTGVDEQPIEKAYLMIIEKSWRYHMYYYMYTLEEHTAEEIATLYEAEKQARLAAPILQAYLDVVAKGTDLGKAKVLKKPACTNLSLYISAKSIFTQSKRTKVTNIADLKDNPAMRDEPRKRSRGRKSRRYFEHPEDNEEMISEEESQGEMPIHD